MVIGGDLLAEDTQRWLAVALGDVAEDLVVSAIFFDDIKAVFDGTCVTDLRRDRVVFAPTCCVDFRVGLKGRGLECDPGHRGELIGARGRYRAECPLEQSTDVLVQALWGWFGGVRSIAIVFAGHPLSVGHKNLIPSFREFDVRRVPTDRDESQGPGFLRLGQIEHCKIVVARVDGDQNALIGRYRDCRGSATVLCGWIQCGGQYLLEFPGGSIKNHDAVFIRTCHCEPVGGLQENHLGRVGLGRPCRFDFPSCQIDHSDLRLAPEAHVEFVVFRVFQKRVRIALFG